MEPGEELVRGVAWRQETVAEDRLEAARAGRIWVECRGASGGRSAAGFVFVCGEDAAHGRA